jgi:hypothetical protein
LLPDDVDSNDVADASNSNCDTRFMIKLPLDVLDAFDAFDALLLALPAVLPPPPLPLRDMLPRGIGDGEKFDGDVRDVGDVRDAFDCCSTPP